MSLTKSWVPGGGMGGGTRPVLSRGEVLKTGYIKKLKTMKKKYFVLRAECEDSPSCLEYYDSEKKWKAHQPPKRVITLQSCFNINRMFDLKQRFVVALYTKDECFCLALDSEEEAEQWLSSLLSTQRGGDDSCEGEPPKPTFEHVWQVQVQNKGLGSSRNILGPYMLCLTSHSLTLVRNGSGGSSNQQGTPTYANANESLGDSVEFSLSTIRCCGHSDCFFYMEVGRSSVTGAGALWMQTEDTYIAQNMHDAILNAMRSCRNGSASTQKADRGAEAELAPNPRTRSSSVNEASRPVTVLQRGFSARYAGQSSNQSQQSLNMPSPGSGSAPPGQSAVGCAWKPQALPHPHPASHSSSQRYSGWVGGVQQRGHLHQVTSIAQNAIHHQQPTAATVSPSQRRHSVSGTGSRERCDSLPFRTRTISEGLPSSTMATAAAHHHHQHHHHHHPSPPSAAHSPSSSSSSSAAHSHLYCVHHCHHLAQGTVGASSPLGVGASGSQYGQHGGAANRAVHLVPSGSILAGARPHSLYSRGISYSPPIVSSPVSPASGACSTTDSAGSSLSMEEAEGWCGSNGGISGVQEGTGVDGGYPGSMGTTGSHGLRFAHSLTPDEPAIMEENADDEYMHWVPGGGSGLEIEEEEECGCGSVEEEGGAMAGGMDEVDGVLRRQLSKKSSSKGRSGNYVPMESSHAGKNALASHPTAPQHHPASLSLPLQPVTLGRPCPGNRPSATLEGTAIGQQAGGLRPSGSPPMPSQQYRAHGEMPSACATSPLDSTDGYVTRSPGGGSGVPIPMECGTSTRVLQDTRQDNAYVSMLPGHPSDDGYVAMDLQQSGGSKSHEDGSAVGRGEMSPAASSSSVTSGTPSTDTRFSGYHLDKVSSYLMPSEEEEEDTAGRVADTSTMKGGTTDDILPMERPVRAYSVGSQSETFRWKNRLDVGNVDSVRVRAFSLGSRQGAASSGTPCATRPVGGASSPSSHHSPHRHHHHHHHYYHHHHTPTSAPGAQPLWRGALSPKSNPSTKRDGGTGKSSSAPFLPALSNSWSGSSTLCSPPASMPSHHSQPGGSTSSKQSHNAASGNSDHDLMELDFSGRGGRTDTVSVKGKADEVKRVEESPYVPMGVPPGSSGCPCQPQQEGMRASSDVTPSSFSPPPPLLLSPPCGGGGGKAHSSASSASSSVALEEDYVHMNYKSGGEGTNSSGYMEMCPVRKSSVAGEVGVGASGDYVSMDGGERLGRGGGGKGPEASRPIAIRKERREGENGGSGGGKEAGMGSSPNFYLAGLMSRKSSSGTPPKGPFPDAGGGSGSPFASLRRRRGRGEEEEIGEKSSDGGDGGGELATPTAIFPFSLNSPSSPVRPFPGHYESAPKCPVDATSGTVHISYPFVPSSPIVTAGNVLPSQGRCDIHQKGEFNMSRSSPPKNQGTRGQLERVVSQCGPEAVVYNVTTSSQSSMPPQGSKYANWPPLPSGPIPQGSDDYMPMAPSNRVRKESVVSGPPPLVVGQSAKPQQPVSSLFSSFSPSSQFAGSAQTKTSSDYVCMKAVPSPSPPTMSPPQVSSAPPTQHRMKSSSADYMEIKLGSMASSSTSPPPKGNNNADDYVEIDLSQKLGVVSHGGQHAVSTSQQSGLCTISKPKTVPSVGGYVPSHTGFGYHSQFSNSRLPSYTWPRKGVHEVRKGSGGTPSPPTATTTAAPPANPNHSNNQKTDDYVQMDLGSKSFSSSSSSSGVPIGMLAKVDLVPIMPLSSGDTSLATAATTTTMMAATETPLTTATVTATTMITTTLITLPLTSTRMTVVTTTPTSSLLTANKPASNSVESLSPKSLDSPLNPHMVCVAGTVPSEENVQRAVCDSTTGDESPMSPVVGTLCSTDSSGAAAAVSDPIVSSSATPLNLDSVFSSPNPMPSCSTSSNTSLSTLPAAISTSSTSANPSSPVPLVTMVASLPVVCPSVSTSSSPTASILPLVASGPINIPTRSNPSLPALPDPPCSPECATTTTCPPDPERKNELQKSSSIAIQDKQASPVKSSCGNPLNVQAKSSKAAASSLLRRVSRGSGYKGQEPRGNRITKEVHEESTGALTSESAVPVTETSEVTGAAESPKSPESCGSSAGDIEGGGDILERRLDSKRVGGGRGGREVCRRSSSEKEQKRSEERALTGEGARSRRQSSDLVKGREAQLAAVGVSAKLNRTGSGAGRPQDTEDKSGSYEKLLAPGSRPQQQSMASRKWQHNSLGERTPGMGLVALRRQMSSPSAIPDPDGGYEMLLPLNNGGGAPSRRRSGDKAGCSAVSGEGPTPVFSASSSSASSSSSLASVASSILLGTMRSTNTSSPPPPASSAQQGPCLGEIHYASLDLAPPSGGNEGEEGSRCGGHLSPKVFVGSGRSGAESPGSSGAVGSAAGSLVTEQPLNYAEIDFSKSIAPAVKSRVRH